MVSAALSAAIKPLLLALSVTVLAASIRRSVKVTRPFTALMVVVPCSSPVPVTRVKVTEAEDEVTRLLEAS